MAIANLKIVTDLQMEALRDLRSERFRNNLKAIMNEARMAAEVCAEAQWRREEADILIASPTFALPHPTPPHAYLSLADKRDVAVIAADLLEKRLSQRPGRLIRLVINSENELCLPPKLGARFRLLGNRPKLFDSLDRDFRSAYEIAAQAGYKNTTSLRQVIGDINQRAMAVLGLDERLIIGEEGRGYKLNGRFVIERLG
jgi:hypothetical protein